MSTHGKQFLIDFTEKERHMLKEYFKNLDSDKSGQYKYNRINRFIGTLRSIYFYGCCK